MNETSRYYVYKKDLPRLAMLIYPPGQLQKLDQPDIISFLLDYYHEKELNKQSND
jgi:hypothetical protein